MRFGGALWGDPPNNAALSNCWGSRQRVHSLRRHPQLAPIILACWGRWKPPVYFCDNQSPDEFRITVICFRLCTLNQNPESPPLRIGLLLDSAELSCWIAEIVNQIMKCNFAQLELLVFNAEERNRAAEPPPRRSRFRKGIELLRDNQRRRRLLFDLYERWDRQNSVRSKDPFLLVDCSALLAHVELISVTPIRKRFVHHFPGEAIERIRERQLDVLIRFGFNILRGDILNVARYGVWSYHHGDNNYYRGGPAYFWEVYEGNPISGAVLQVLTEELDAGKVLYKGLFATYPGVSRVRNCVQPYWGASTFVIQKLRELHQCGWDHIERAALSPAPYSGKKKIYTVPSNSEMLSWLGPLTVRKLWRRLMRRPMIKHWRMAIRSTGTLIAGSGPLPDLTGFRWIESPKGRFFADPFMIELDGKLWVFFEDFDYATQRGRISCAQVLEDGISDPTSVLERPYHLSYPCIFPSGNELYMIPETSSNGTVELYRCVRFPDRWNFEKELFKAPAVDTTIWIDENLYWFFVTVREPRGFGTQLWLFYATTLTGDWTPHPGNPISTNVVKQPRGRPDIPTQREGVPAEPGLQQALWTQLYAQRDRCL